MELWYWLLLLAIFIIIEIVTLGLTTIWFAFGALVAYLAGLLFGANLLAQIACFFVVSFLLLFFTRPVAVRYFNSDRKKTNLDSIIGRQGKVTQSINNDEAKGIVVLDGKEWTARSEEGQIIEKDCQVKAVAISGVKLIVTDKL